MSGPWVGRLGIMLAACASARAAPPPISAYADLPAAWGARLSPDGRNIAAIGALAGKPAIVILHTDGRPPKVFSAGGWSPTGVLWKTNDTVLASLRTVVMNQETGHPNTQSRLLIASIDGSRVRSSDFVFFSAGSEPNIDLQVLSLLPGDPEHILVSTWRGGSLGIRYGLFDDSQRVAVDTFDHVRRWYADPAGVVRAGYKIEDASMLTRRRQVILYGRTGAQDRWHPVLTETITHKSRIGLAGFSDSDPDLVYLLRDGPTGYSEIEGWRISTGVQISTLAADASADIQPIVHGGHLLGYQAGDHEPVYLDAAWAHDQHAISKALGAGDVSIIDRTQDGKRVLAQVTDGAHPATVFLLDRGGAKITLSPVITPYNSIPDDQVAAARQVSYSARDGMVIPAILTMPPGAPHKPIPFVVLPHGGPASHDVLGFDWMAQFLASRGYGVLQPEFRGSTGFGAKLENAGLQQWGLAMQDDLTDGTRWLADQHLADPKRIAIVGQSYGGYAALKGVEREPSLYRCAVAIAPVTDLGPMFGGMKAFVESDIDLPVMAANFDQMEAASPANKAASITVPVMLLHGEDDFTVPVTQSRHMEHAMKAAGKPVEAIYLKGGDHYLQNAADRAQVLTALERFLAANMATDRS